MGALVANAFDAAKSVTYTTCGHTTARGASPVGKPSRTLILGMAASAPNQRAGRRGTSLIFGMAASAPDAVRHATKVTLGKMGGVYCAEP